SSCDSSVQSFRSAKEDEGSAVAYSAIAVVSGVEAAASGSATAFHSNCKSSAAGASEKSSATVCTSGMKLSKVGTSSPMGGEENMSASPASSFAPPNSCKRSRERV